MEKEKNMNLRRLQGILEELEGGGIVISIILTQNSRKLKILTKKVHWTKEIV